MSLGYKTARVVPVAAISAIITLTSIEVSAQLGIEEIVVTSRKREENMQRVPIAITAFTEATLARADIQNLEDLARFTTNLTFAKGPIGRHATPVLRGLGLIDTRGFDNHVGLFIDGVYISGRSGLNVSMFDLDRVEVVKGPQSALYGRNTFAGAINYITKKPTDEFEGKLTATLGQYNEQRFMGTMSGPIIEDELYVRVAASYNHNNGTYKNGALPGGLGGHEFKTASLAFRWTPNEDFEANLKGYYTDDLIDSAPVSAHLDNNAGNIRGLAFYYIGEVTDFGSRTLPGLSAESFAQDRSVQRYDLNMDYEFENVTLTSITAWNKLVNTGFEDFDRTQGGQLGGPGLQFGYTTIPALFPPFFPHQPFGPFGPTFQVPFPSAPGPTVSPLEVPTFVSFASAHSEYWSQELRITSDDDQDLRWLAGAYFFRSRNRGGIGANFDVSSAPPEATFFLTWNGPAFPGFQGPATPQVLFNRNSNVLRENLTRDNAGGRQMALYAQVAYDFTDQLTGTAEARWTDEDRFNVSVYDFFFGDGLSGLRNDTSFDFIDPRFTLQYQANEDVMVYGSIAKGSRSGGINPGSFSFPGGEDFMKYDPESNWTFEGGMKSSWADGRVQLNLSAFYIDWTDIQFRTSLAGGDAFFSVTRNLGDITTKGFELELTARPIDQLDIFLGYGYADPSFADGSEDTSRANLCNNVVLFGSDCTIEPSTGGFRGANISNNQLSRTSKHTLSTNFQYTDSLSSDIDWYVRGDLSFRSKQWNDTVNLYYVGSQTRSNARIGIVSDTFDINFWVTNLTNGKTPDEGNDITSNFNSQREVIIVINTERRKFGISSTYRF